MDAQKNAPKKVLATLFPYIFHMKSKWNIVYRGGGGHINDLSNPKLQENSMLKKRLDAALVVSELDSQYSIQYSKQLLGLIINIAFHPSEVNKIITKLANLVVKSYFSPHSGMSLIYWFYDFNTFESYFQCFDKNGYANYFSCKKLVLQYNADIFWTFGSKESMTRNSY